MIFGYFHHHHITRGQIWKSLKTILIKCSHLGIWTGGWAEMVAPLWCRKIWWGRSQTHDCFYIVRCDMKSVQPSSCFKDPPIFGWFSLYFKSSLHQFCWKFVFVWRLSWGVQISGEAFSNLCWSIFIVGTQKEFHKQEEQCSVSQKQIFQDCQI